MKKIVCLALALGLMLCACCAWAAEPVVIDFSNFDWRNDNYDTYAAWYWDLKDYLEYNYRLYINESGEYTIRNMHDNGGLLAASIIIGHRADNVTLNLENVKISGSNVMGERVLCKEDAGTLNVKLGKDTVLSSSRVIVVDDLIHASEGESFVLNVSGKGRIEGGTGISVIVSKSNIDCPVTVNVSGSVQIEGESYGIRVINSNLSGNSGDVTVNVSGSAKVTALQGSEYGIFAHSFAENGNSGDVTVNVTGNAQLIAESDVFLGIAAESYAAGGDSGDVSVSAGPGVDIADGISGIGAISNSLSGGSSGEVRVTVDGSRFTCEGYGISAGSTASSRSSGNVLVSVRGTHITGKGGAGIDAYSGSYHGSSGDVQVSVSGGAKIASEKVFGISARSSNAGRSVVTLGDNVTVQGERGAICTPEKDKGELIIDGDSYPGIVAEKSMEYSGAGAMALSSSPYYDANKNVFAEAGTWTKEDAASNNNDEFVTNARFIRTLWSPQSAVLPQTGSLPQTGDSSRLALWGAMLAIALAGAWMMARKNREA